MGIAKSDKNTFRVAVQIGEIWNNTAPSWGNVQDWKAIANNLEVDGDLTKIPVTGYSDTELNNYGTRSFTLTMDSFVPARGFSFFEANRGPMLGRWIRIITLEDSSLNAPRNWEGVIDQWKYRAPSDDKPHAENIRVDLNPNFQS